MDTDVNNSAESDIVVKTEPDLSDTEGNNSNNFFNDNPSQEKDLAKTNSSQLSLQTDIMNIVPFPFERLPAELKRMIIGYAIPENLSFRFTTSGNRHSSRTWNVQAKGVGRAAGFVTLIHRNGPLRKPTAATLQVLDQLRTYAALVCVKATFLETHAIFFNQNEFSFYLGGRKSDTLTVFGPFGENKLQQYLRDMKQIRLVLNINDSSTKAYTWHRKRVQQFVDQLRRDSGDKQKQSRLECLKLGIALKGVDYVYSDEPEAQFLVSDYVDMRVTAEKHMFTFEPLAELRHIGTIKEVSITGIPLGFAKCLELCIMGKGGDVFPLGWISRYGQVPEGIGQATRSVPKYRSWKDPVYDWEEFALRNIALSEDLELFYFQDDFS